MKNNLPSLKKSIEIENTIFNQLEKTLSEFYPIYITGTEIKKENIEENSSEILKSMEFYKIDSCIIEKKENISEFLNEKMQKFIVGLYSSKTSFCYGVISDGQKCDLLLGINKSSHGKLVSKIIHGLLSGIKIVKWEDKKEITVPREYFGMINGIPSLYVNNKLQKFDLGTIVRSLNEEKFSMFVIAKPLPENIIREKINAAMDIKNTCFSLSKMTIGNQENTGSSTTETFGETKTQNVKGEASKLTQGLALVGTAIGGALGAMTGGISAPVGAMIGSATGNIAGEFLGSNSDQGGSVSNTYQKTIVETINKTETVSIEIQNQAAIELMKMADSSLDRLKMGRNVGMWETSITYSTEDRVARDILQGCIYGEVAKPQIEVLPPLISETSKELLDRELLATAQHLLIPKGLLGGKEEDSKMCSFVNSQELSAICSIPEGNTPAFELKEGTFYPLVGSKNDRDKNIKIGSVCDGEQELSNIEFSLSEEDLNKHTFVCGITGSGKSNTVKEILYKADKPFFVIESAKKEYRGMKKEYEDLKIYTLGKPEINCPQINPFYILPGVNPQMHIDMLKDLFNASFSFYGPMPYILEKCLHNIYIKKGWNLTLGYHPYIANIKSKARLFDERTIKLNYRKENHKYLFPTMEDLKDEIESYIKNELDYQGETVGNIKTAIKTRLESLCVGAKGYMYNTFNYLNWEDLLSRKCVFEMEGLADDADKAFSVGLLVIFINEQRQIEKELDYSSENRLKHILVIEEAHRLLKNVETERSSENMGNPKGKAVEHFTNMIAEMRSYGQGVIIAEQIPTKIAPDVIKNTSNKIIHRIVAEDDQRAINSSICMPIEKGIYLGTQKTGFALCHKEGMHSPVLVKVSKVKNKLVKDLDLFRPETIENIFKREILDALNDEIKKESLKLLSNFLITNSKGCLIAIEEVSEKFQKYLIEKNIEKISGVDEKNSYFSLISDKIVGIMSYGLFSNKEIVPKNILNELNDALMMPYEEKIDNFKKLLSDFYRNSIGKDAEELGISIIGEFVYSKGSKIKTREYISNILGVKGEGEIDKCIKYVKERRNREWKF